MEVAFTCSRRGGAALVLPVTAQREDTLAQGDFATWITRHIDTWFAFARRLGLGIGQMEDIVLVTGCHRTRSWSNIAFYESQTVTQVSLGVQVTGSPGAGAGVKWRASDQQIQGAVLSHGPSGEVSDVQIVRAMDTELLWSLELTRGPMHICPRFSCQTNVQNISEAQRSGRTRS